MSSDSKDSDTSPQPSSPFEGVASPTSPPIGGRRKFIRGFGLFKRDPQQASTVAEPDMASPAAVDSDDASKGSSASSFMENVELASLTKIQPHVGRLTTLQELEDEAVRKEVALTERQFNFRVAAPPLSPLNISPDSRETFEAMVWTLLIIRQPDLANQDAAVPVPEIPLIKTMPVYEIKVVPSNTTALVITTLDTYFLRTEALVRVYSMPPHVVHKLAKVATDINSCIFARYMGARGKWSLRRCFGGLQVLLRWWAATTPYLMTEYASAISLQSACMDNYTRSMLRLEVRELLGIRSDQEEHEKILDTAISRGFEEVARLRRELHVVIQDAFDDLVERAQTAGVAGHP